MRDVRNPFRLQTAESIDTDADFLRLFGHGVLDLLPGDALSGRPLFIRSAPGGGKTSLLKLFTPTMLQCLIAMRGSDATKELYNRLKDMGAVTEHDVNVLAVMIPCSRTFPALADVGLKPHRARRLLLALIDARIILGALRAVLIARRLRFPDDLPRLTLTPPPDEQIPGLTFPCDGAVVKSWVENVEQGVCDLIDTLLSPDGAGPSGHDSLLSLRLLDASCIQLDGNLVETRWLVTFDDMQKLAATQRAALLEVVVEQRSKSTIWLAERFEALSTDELLSNGVLNGRDCLVIALEKAWQEKRRFEPAVVLIADRRARMAADATGANFALGAFRPLIEADLDTPAWYDRTASALETVRTRVQALAQSKPQYGEWIQASDAAEGTLRQQLIKWRTVEILIERHSRKRQLALDLGPLTREELEHKDESDVRAAAELFLSREFGFPYYFGLNRLASLGSFNVEQFLRLAGDLFEESLAAAVMRRDPRLLPERQQKILDGAYDARVKDLPMRARNGRDVLAFLDAVGRFCRDETFQPNAPYAPGVTGIAISMSECEALRDKEHLRRNPDAAVFAAVLTTALQYNLLLPDPDRPRPSGRYMVLYLNRLLCPKYQLPLHFGGYREKRLREVASWVRYQYQPSRSERSLL